MAEIRDLAIAGEPGSDTVGRPHAGLLARDRRAWIAALALVALAAWVIYLLLVLWSMLHAAVGQYDFSTYYAAALALRHNLRADIYSQAVIARAGALAHVQVQPPLPYTYPPLFAYLLIPLTVLPFRVAARVWMAVNVAIWLGCVALLAVELRRVLRPALSTLGPTQAVAESDLSGVASLWRRAVAEPSALVALAFSATLCLPFAPAQQTLLLGQINFLVLLPLALVPWLTRARHERGVGVAIACAAMLKLTPGVLLLYLALRRRWEALIAAVVALVALTLVSLLLTGPGTFFELLPQALHVGAGDATLGHNEALFAPAFATLSAAVPGFTAIARPLTYALLGALAVAIGWVLWRAPRPNTSSHYPLSADYPAYAVALCAVVLLSPTAWVHHYLWLLPACALAAMTLVLVRLAPSAGERRRARTLLVLAALGCVLLALGLPYEWDTQPRPATTLLFGLPLHGLALELRPIGALLVLLVAAALALRGGIIPAERAQGE